MPLSPIKRDPRWMWLWSAISPVVALYMFVEAKLMLLTSSVATRGPGADYSGAAVYVNWHKYVPFLCVHHGQKRRCLLMSSAPYLAPVAMWCRWMGLTVVRGAPGERSGESLGRLLEALKAGQSVALAADGPAGPGFQAKHGCTDLACAAGVPVIPLACQSQKGRSNLNRWDRMYRTRMFDTIEVRYGEPIVVDPAEPEASALQRVQAGLDALESRLAQSSLASS